VGALLVIALGVMTLPDDGVVQDAKEYCRNVHAQRWPDFHHVYAQQCKPDGTVNMSYVYGR
jgi:hypothetical protein